MFAGFSSLPTAVSDASVCIPAPEHHGDPRLDSLQRFFAKGECPVGDLSQEFLAAADDHDLDWRLLPSISFIESTGGKAARGNNIFGWDNGLARFASVRAGIHVVAYRLATSELYRDKDLDGILMTYNPGADYAGKVKSVMRHIAPAE
jgi:hypothetical protein